MKKEKGVLPCIAVSFGNVCMLSVQINVGETSCDKVEIVTGIVFTVCYYRCSMHSSGECY